MRAPSFVAAAEYGPKHPKAVTIVEKDADVLLTFFDFPQRALEAAADLERGESSRRYATF